METSLTASCTQSAVSNGNFKVRCSKTVLVEWLGWSIRYTHVLLLQIQKDLIADQRIEQLKERIRTGIQPTKQAWIDVRADCDQGLGREPHPVERWGVPGFYEGPEATEEASRTMSYI